MWNGKQACSTATTTRQYLLGVVFDDAFTTPKRIVNFMNAEQGSNIFAFDGTSVKQYTFNMDYRVMPQAYLSELISAVDLPVPITKNEDDVLRITYQYKLLQLT